MKTINATIKIYRKQSRETEGERDQTDRQQQQRKDGKLIAGFELA